MRATSSGCTKMNTEMLVAFVDSCGRIRSRVMVVNLPVSEVGDIVWLETRVRSDLLSEGEGDLCTGDITILSFSRLEDAE